MTNKHMSDVERAVEFLDRLDPETSPADDPVELRRIGLAVRGIEASQDELREAVAAARASGRSWSHIGMVLGVTKQAAQERFGAKTATG